MPPNAAPDHLPVDIYLLGITLFGLYFLFHNPHRYPVQEDEREWFASASFYGLESGDTSISVPINEVGVRSGVTPRSDVGFKFHYRGASLDYNYAIILHRHFTLSLNPYISTSWFGDGVVGSALLNILADVVRIRKMTLTVGLKPGFFYGFTSIDDDIDDSTFRVLGYMAGARFDLGPRLSIMPTFDVITSGSEMGSDRLFNVGAAIIF